MLKDRMKWPEGASCAAMITVNLEAEYFAKMCGTYCIGNRFN